MQLTMVVKAGGKELVRVFGKSIPDEVFQLSDLNKVVEVEQYLERVFGHRFHISISR